jgi:hypothetical protein
MPITLVEHGTHSLIICQPQRGVTAPESWTATFPIIKRLNTSHSSTSAHQIQRELTPCGTLVVGQEDGYTPFVYQGSNPLLPDPFSWS